MLILMNNTLYTSPILIIYGPTGVGKTDIALAIASRIPAEIINMDVGQFYTPFSIGTAKPDWKNETAVHHLFDSIDTPRNYTVVEYRNVVQEKIKEITARGNIPILVGGSAFYLYTLLFPIHEKSDTDHLHSHLEYNPIGDYILVYAIRDTQELNTRINQRVISMVDHGWLEETQQLLGTEWEVFIQKKKLIGYNDIIDYLRGDQDKESFESMVEVVQNKTRQYAKKQRTFWRKIERDIKKQYSYSGQWIGCLEILNLTNTDLRLYINELLKRLFIHG